MRLVMSCDALLGVGKIESINLYYIYKYSV